MAFPDSPISFTTKNTGDVIQAAHVNDLQTEVANIEAGYINATAPLNSSRSTVATLSVTGASTFASRPVMPPPDMAKVFLASTYAAGSSDNSTLSFLAQDYLINSSLHSTVTNPERLTPQTTGVYQFSAQIEVEGSVPDLQTRFVLIQDSSAGVIAAAATRSSGIFRMNVTGYKRYDILGGFAAVRFATAGGATTNSLSSGVNLTWFSVLKL